MERKIWNTSSCSARKEILIDKIKSLWELFHCDNNEFGINNSCCDMTKCDVYLCVDVNH